MPRLNKDSDFKRLYIVPGHSVTQVSGRELGSQHRDALYSIFRLRRKETLLVDPDSTWRRRGFIAEANWRDIVRLMGVSGHVNNVATLKREKAMSILSTMVGAVTLARIVNDPRLAQSILDAAADSIRETASSKKRRTF